MFFVSLRLNYPLMLTQQIRERGFSKIRSLRVLRATHLRPETLARAVALPARGSHAREGVGIQFKDTKSTDVLRGSWSGARTVCQELVR